MNGEFIMLRLFKIFVWLLWDIWFFVKLFCNLIWDVLIVICLMLLLLLFFFVCVYIGVFVYDRLIIMVKVFLSKFMGVLKIKR